MVPQVASVQEASLASNVSGEVSACQEKLLFYLSEEVTRTPAVFEQAEIHPIQQNPDWSMEDLKMYGPIICRFCSGGSKEFEGLTNLYV